MSISEKLRLSSGFSFKEFILSGVVTELSKPWAHVMARVFKQSCLLRSMAWCDTRVVIHAEQVTVLRGPLMLVIVLTSSPEGAIPL